MKKIPDENQIGKDIFDLRDLGGEELQKVREAVEDQTGYEFDKLKENEPTMIKDSYMETYAQELADDIGAIDSNQNWPINCIDWGEATDQLLADYTEITIDGIIYHFRSF